MRWQAASQEITARQGEALRVFAETGTVAETAEILELTPARIYAMFGQVSKRLGISSRLLRSAVLDGTVDVSLCPEPNRSS